MAKGRNWDSTQLIRQKISGNSINGTTPDATIDTSPRRAGAMRDSPRTSYLRFRMV